MFPIRCRIIENQELDYGTSKIESGACDLSPGRSNEKKVVVKFATRGIRGHPWESTPAGRSTTGICDCGVLCLNIERTSVYRCENLVTFSAEFRQISIDALQMFVGCSLDVRWMIVRYSIKSDWASKDDR